MAGGKQITLAQQDVLASLLCEPLLFIEVRRVVQPVGAHGTAGQLFDADTGATECLVAGC